MQFKFSEKGRNAYPLFLGEKNAIDRIMMDGVIELEVIGGYLPYTYFQLLQVISRELVKYDKIVIDYSLRRLGEGY